MYVTGSPVVPAGSSISHNTLPDALSYARNILPPPPGGSPATPSLPPSPRKTIVFVTSGEARPP
jgi:hypothetical protein